MRRKLPGSGGTLSIKATWPCLLAILFGPLSSSVLAQADVEAGRLKADTCLGCHGIPGYTNVYPSYHVPKLGGQHADYIVAALQAYKTGQRDHDTMHAQAATLSDQDMANIAAYFESLGSMAPGGKAPQQTAKSDAAAPAAGAGGQQKPAKSAGGAQQPKASGGKAAQKTQSAPQSQASAAGAGIEEAAASGASPANKSVYQTACSACHDSGAMGAPKTTDKGAWQARTVKGAQALYTSAISGIGAMPAKGGNPQLSDAEVKQAVDYILSEVAGGEQSATTAGATQPQSGKEKKGQ